MTSGLHSYRSDSAQQLGVRDVHRSSSRVPSGQTSRFQASRVSWVGGSQMEAQTGSHDPGFGAGGRKIGTRVTFWYRDDEVMPPL